MKRNNQYVDLDGRVFLLRGLDDEERKLLAACQKYAKSHDSADYTNYWLPKVRRLYAERGLNGRQIVETPLFQIAQDMGNRIDLVAGRLEMGDYRDELDVTRFRTRREFCAATGLSEDLLSHVLARRKHMAIDTLTEALAWVPTDNCTARAFGRRFRRAGS
jgi:hypothetical protein